MKLLAAVGVGTTLALFGFMLWFAFTGDETRNPDELDQVGFPPVAEELCAVRQDAIAALPPAFEAETPTDRADLVDQGTVIVVDMVDALEVEVESREVVAELPNPLGDLDEDEQALLDSGVLSQRDHDNLTAWLGDYRTYIDDRLRHTERLRTEGDVAFLVTDVEGVGVDERIDGYARVNDMDSCGVPGDL